MNQSEPTNPLESFVDALLQSTGQVMLIVDHMSRCVPSEPPERRFDEVLRELLIGVLESAYKRRGDADFATAAALLEDAGAAIGEDLFLVEPDPGGSNGASSAEP